MTDQIQVRRRGLFCGFLPALILCAYFLAPAQSAAKGFVLITYGDDISKVADIPPTVLEGVKQSTGAANPEIGYKYGTFGIFYLNIWTWGGEYVIFEEDTYWDLGEEAAAQMLGVTVDKLEKPTFYTFPPGLIILIVLIIAFLVYTFVLSKNDDEEAPAAAEGAANKPADKDEDEED